MCDEADIKVYIKDGLTVFEMKYNFQKVQGQPQLILEKVFKNVEKIFRT